MTYNKTNAFILKNTYVYFVVTNKIAIEVVN